MVTERSFRAYRILSIAAIAGLAAAVLGTAPAAAQSYAAVAVDGSGAWGASLGLQSRRQASADAIRRCPGSCRVVMVGPGRCVAFADSSRGGYWYGHAYGGSANAVRRIALQGCRLGAPAGTCQLRHVNCV